MLEISPQMNTEVLGEVVQASVMEFTAQCSRLHEPPHFGAFVRIGSFDADSDPFAPAAEEGAIYGLVYHSYTESREPNRRATAYGLAGDALRREQPQIFELLRTWFSCLSVAHVVAGQIRTYLPPQPPRVHAMVDPCNDAEVCAITERFGFLRAVVDSPTCMARDELIAAAIREGSRCRGYDREYFVRAGKEVAMLLRDDQDRLRSILRKLEAAA